MLIYFSLSCFGFLPIVSESLYIQHQDPMKQPSANKVVKQLKFLPNRPVNQLQSMTSGPHFLCSCQAGSFSFLGKTKVFFCSFFSSVCPLPKILCVFFQLLWKLMALSYHPCRVVGGFSHSKMGHCNAGGSISLKSQLPWQTQVILIGRPVAWIWQCVL